MIDHDREREAAKIRRAREALDVEQELRVPAERGNALREPPRRVELDAGPRHQVRSEAAHAGCCEMRSSGSVTVSSISAMPRRRAGRRRDHINDELCCRAVEAGLHHHATSEANRVKHGEIIREEPPEAAYRGGLAA